MKKNALLLFLLQVFSFNSIAQTDTVTADTTVIYERCSFFMKTPPLRDMLSFIDTVDGQYAYLNESEKPYRLSRYNDIELIEDIGIPGNGNIDPALQTNPASRPTTSFRSRLNINGQNGAFPPDPTGAAGQDYYVQAVNSTYQIFQKTGPSASPQLLLNTLWDKIGLGDPIVMYDSYAKRWFISQFWGNSEEGGDNGILIAISATSDPLGSYYTYEFPFTLFPDYPKYSVWSNAYFMTSNSSSADFAAFEREKMLVGDPTAAIIKMTFPDIPLSFNSICPAYAEGATPPDDNSPCYFFAVQDNSFSGVEADHIKIIKSVIDWNSPWTSSLTIHQSIPTLPFNTVFSDTWDDITQKGTTQKLDAITGIFMYKAQYRRFPDYNVIMLCHTVDVDNTNRAGVRWYELRDANDGNWSIYQQGTYSPDGENNRWIPSISMNSLGHIALAYSFSGPDHYPGIRYTGRFKGDPLGEMTVQEQIGFNGKSAQTSGRRYGDYSQMTMDPADGNTFWYTGEYIGLSSTRRTRIISFSSWDLNSTDENVNQSINFNVYQPNNNLLQFNWTGSNNEKTVFVTVINQTGQTIVSKETTNDGEELVQIPNVASGIFIAQLKTAKGIVNRKFYIGN